MIILGIREDVDENPDYLAPSDPVTVHDAIGHLPALRSGLSASDSEERWRERRAAMFTSKTLRSLPLAASTAIAGALEAPAPKAGRGASFVAARTGTKHNSVLERWLVSPSLAGFIQHESRSHMDSDLARYVFAAAAAQINDGRSLRLEDWPPFLLPAHRNVRTEDDGTVSASGFHDRFKVQSWSDASSTVTSHIAKDGHYSIHPDPRQARSLTVREAARLQTFQTTTTFAETAPRLYPNRERRSTAFGCAAGEVVADLFVGEGWEGRAAQLAGAMAVG